MTNLSVTFGRLEVLLTTYFRIDPDRQGTFRARIKQLQRLNFPTGVNVGRGARFEYEIEHVIKLIFAFELLAVGVPAKLATDIVENGWDRISAAIQLVVGTWSCSSDQDDVYCIVAPDLLNDASELSNAVLVYEREYFVEAASGDDFKPAAMLSVNVTKLMRRFYAHGDHVRLEERKVKNQIRQWKTMVPELYGLSWANDWLKMSWVRLKEHAPIDEDSERIPF